MRTRRTEGARVHEAPEPGVLGAEDGIARAGDDPLESDAENVGDDLEEETGEYFDKVCHWSTDDRQQVVTAHRCSHC